MASIAVLNDGLATRSRVRAIVAAEAPGKIGVAKIVRIGSPGDFHIRENISVVDRQYGCGRLLEGSAPVMWESLTKLRNLPPETEIYCGHEYTAANVHFALTIEPNNAALRARAEEVVRLCSEGQPTIPTTISAEKSTNPFLRADLPSVAAAINRPDDGGAQIFAVIRARKDAF